MTFSVCVLFFFLAVVLPFGQLVVGSFFRFIGFLSVGHADSGALQESIQQQRCLACVSKHHVSRRHRFNRDHDPRRHCRLCVGAHTVARAAPPRYVGVAALDDAGHGPGGRSSLGLCDHPRAGADLWHDLGAVPAYLTLGTPLSVRIMAGAYAQLSFDLEELSCVHGAGWWQTLWRILVALSWPAFAVGWTLSFFGIMRELSASVLLFSIGNEVLSASCSVFGRRVKEEVMVIGLMTMFLVFLFRWVQLILIIGR